MIAVAKVLAMACCGAICYQDFKERSVYWFFFPILGLALGFLFYAQTTVSYFMIGSLANIALVSLILLILYLYAKYISKKAFLDHSLGLGDMLLFFVLAIGFPPVTFIILFAASVFFSLAAHLFLRHNLRNKTVPLAGFMALFLAIVLGYSLFFDLPSLYFI